MFGKDFQRKYALTDQGIKNTKQGTVFTVIVNLVVMGGMGILYLLMTKFMDTLTTGAPLPNALTFILLVLAFVVLSLITHMQQYRSSIVRRMAWYTVKSKRSGSALPSA